jgi:hypothetical protein
MSFQNLQNINNIIQQGYKFVLVGIAVALVAMIIATSRITKSDSDERQGLEKLVTAVVAVCLAFRFGVPLVWWGLVSFGGNNFDKVRVTAAIAIMGAGLIASCFHMVSGYHKLFLVSYTDKSVEMLSTTRQIINTSCVVLFGTMFIGIILLIM